MTNNKQEELFIINDIDMNINPSDVQVMDDNWVMEDSYLRSKAVFCFRSQYSATKVVLNIPFQITNLNEVAATELNNTYNCIRLVTELVNYPFCFIRNQRIRTYISPTSVSETGYMMFAVDEVSLVKYSAASNILFLEVVLQFYNHKALIQDFTFRSNLNVSVTSGKNSETDETKEPSVVLEKTALQKQFDQIFNKKDTVTENSPILIRDIPPLPCSSLQDSAIWKKFIRPKESKVYSELVRTGLMPTSLANSKSIHPSMGVKIMTPLMFSINQDEENFDDGRLIENDCKVITVTNISNYDNGTFENLLATLATQDFTSDSVFENNTPFTTGSESIVKQGTLTSKEDRAKSKEAKIKEAIKITEKEDKNKDPDNKEKDALSGSTSVFIQWQGENISELQMGITSIKVSKKNRLVSQQISSFKHPVIQYMGKYPATVSITMNSVNQDVYKTDTDYPTNILIKQILNILDFNKSNIPEAEAYNYLKIRSLSTILMGCENYVPSQSVVSASANQQGVENIVYTFHESDMSTFIEDRKIDPSGKLSTNKATAQMTEMIVRWLGEFAIIFPTIMNDKSSKETYIHALETFKLIAQLAITSYDELGFEKNKISEALAYYSTIISELKPNNNILKTVELLPKDLNPKEFSKYNLYNKVVKYIIKEKTNEAYDSKFANSPGAIGRNYYPRLSQETKTYVETVKNDKAIDVSLYTIFRAFIPFIVTVLITRQNIMEGKGTNVGGVSFIESGKYSNLLLGIVARLEAGLKNGEEAAAKSIDTEEVRTFLENFSKDYANTFFGYNYEDLDLEDISPTKYDRKTDLLIQNIDPFFFLVETTHLDGNELQSMYDAMYSETSDLQRIPEEMNKQNNTAKNNVDATISSLNIDYRKLKEIDYVAPTEANNYEDGVGGKYGLIMSGSNGRLGKEIPIANDVVSAIEKALKYYGYDKDPNFRQLIYAFLHVESANGTKLKSSTGATGIFQITDSAMAQVLMNNNKVIDSSNTKIPSNLDRNSAYSTASTLKSKLLTDHFLNANVAIEYIQWIRNKYTNDITLNGKQDPVLIYIGYNLGVGSLQQANSLLSRQTATAPVTISNIKKQGNVSGVAWNGNHYETVTSYMKVISDRSFSFNNVPEYLRPENKSIVDLATNKVMEQISKQKNREDLAKGIVKDANGNLVVKINKDNKPLIFKDSNNNVKKIDEKYENFIVTKSKADKSNLVTNGKFISGYIVSKNNQTETEDGDTFYFVDKNNKKYDIRLYGIDAPETTHVGKGANNDIAEVLGEKAKNELTKMAFGKYVTIQDMGLDSHNRTVAKLILSDGTDPALTLLRNGLGFVPDSFISDGSYKQAETEARENNRGIWSVPNGIAYKPRQRILEKDKKNNPTKVVPVNDANVEASKNANKLKFTQNDFNYASKANANKLNNYQPLLGGPYKVSSPYGTRDSGFHHGVDFKTSKGTTVIAAASGFAVAKDNSNDPSGKVGYGWYIEIDHGNGFVTRYGHLSKRFIDYKGKKVVAGEKIGLTGGVPGEQGSGRTSGAHLHYEVRYNGKPINPFGTRLLTEYKEGDPVGTGNTTLPPIDVSGALAAMKSRTGVNDENTVYNEDKLAAAIFERMYKYTNIGLKSSLPAIKVYLTVGNENDHFWLNPLKSGIQYYELKGIKSFAMTCNSDVNPVDTVVMEIADPSFLNTDAFMGLKKMQGIVVNKIGTDYETQFTNNSLLLKAGVKLHIRCGYSNNPSELDVIFNGTVTDVNITNPQNLQVICESFSKELLSEILAPDEPKMLNNQYDNISTSGVIGEALMSKAITHFGYSSSFWSDTFKGSQDPEDRSLAPGTFSFSYDWGFDLTKAKFKSRLFTNIFAPEVEALDGVYRDKTPIFRDWIQAFSGLYTQGYPFAVYRMTPWDCLKQMEYRHPATICKPKWFEDRMTLFYGIKEQMYFAKDLNKAAQFIAANQKEDSTGGYVEQDYYSKRRDRMLPAVDMHLVTSSHNLISNGLRLNTSYATVTNVNYTDDSDEKVAAMPWKMKSTKLKMDDNIFNWDLREKNLTLSSCVSKYMAFCYGTTDLKKEAEKMYMGKITILGNPTMKAGDYVFIDDSEKRIQGLILVRECVHIFDDRRGFITEIVPGQYVEPANFLYSSLWFKLMCCSKVATSKLRNITKSNYTAKDFNAVFDYLTIMNQLEIALDKFESRSVTNEIIDNSMYALGTGSVAALSLYITDRLSRMLGPKSSKLGIGGGTLRYIKSLHDINTSWIGFTEFGQDVAQWLKVTDAAEKISGKISGLKQTIGGSKYAEYAKRLKDSAKVYVNGTKTPTSVVGKAFTYTGRFLMSPFRFSGSATTRASIFAGKVLARSMLVGLIAIPVAGVATVLLDVIAAFAIQWAFDKIEENQLIRQPLLFFPLTRHGRPYVAGMSGLVRNSWWDSKQTEWAKTLKEVTKAAEIISENGNLAGKENNTFISILNSIGQGASDKRAGPTYATDLNGQKLKLDKNGNVVITDPKEKVKKTALDQLVEEEYKSLTEEEKNKKEIQSKLSKVIGDNVGRSAEL